MDASVENDAQVAEAARSEPEPLQSFQTPQSILPLGHPRRIRDRITLSSSPTNTPQIARRPSDAHHITFAQPRAMGMKVSDEFSVPLCRLHHRAACHYAGNELAWWNDLKIDPIEVAHKLWQQSRSAPARDAETLERTRTNIPKLTDRQISTQEADVDPRTRKWLSGFSPVRRPSPI